jgi:hypothetical protein
VGEVSEKLLKLRMWEGLKLFNLKKSIKLLSNVSYLNGKKIPPFGRNDFLRFDLAKMYGIFALILNSIVISTERRKSLRVEIKTVFI